MEARRNLLEFIIEILPYLKIAILALVVPETMGKQEKRSFALEWRLSNVN